jgi:hypothetical protein
MTCATATPKAATPRASLLAVLPLLLGMLPVASATVAAQERDVVRRSYTFLENRLSVAVLADAPGVLQIVRGERGRVEVAARASDGFAGSGLGGELTRELRLTAVGAAAVQYLVVVPERVSVRVTMPDGTVVTMASGTPAASYRWGEPAAGTGAGTGAVTEPELQRTTGSGLYVVHSTPWAPATIDLPDIQAVRSISLRFGDGDFRVAASRPMSVQPGSRERMEVRVNGEPLDLVIHLPLTGSGVTVRAAGTRIAESSGGRPRALCDGVVVQAPTQHQLWLTFHPRSGRLECR